MEGKNDKTTNVGTKLQKAQEDVLVDFLCKKWNMFAWKPFDMPNVPREVGKHSLNIKLGLKPANQCLRRFNEKFRAIKAEVEKLKATKFIEEVQHPNQLANLVLVPKKNNQWRMYVYYKGLSKACPKDPYSLLQNRSVSSSPTQGTTRSE